MEENKILRIVYMFFVGVLLAIFIGVGVDAFYTAPKAPSYPTELSYAAKEPTAEQQQAQQKFETDNNTYMEKMKPYNRNVSIITLVAAVSLLVVSIAYENRIKFLANGIMLGGLFTLLYSIGRGFASENNKYVFLVVSVGLAVSLYLGYHRFIEKQPEQTSKPKTKKPAKKRR